MEYKYTNLKQKNNFSTTIVIFISYIISFYFYTFYEF